MTSMEGNILNKDFKIFLSYTRSIWDVRKRIMIWTISFGLFGFGITKLSTKIYTSKSVFVPQTEKGSGELESLGGLASLAGLSLGSIGKSTEIPPDLYPELIKSIDFQRDLMNAILLTNNEGNDITYRDYYNDFDRKITINNFFQTLGSRINRVLSSKVYEPEIDTIGISKIKIIARDEGKHLKRIERQLDVNVKKKEGIVELSFSMPDPYLSAKMTFIAEQLLQKEIISYRIKAAQQQLEFTEQRYLESKKNFELIQDKRANFNDGNRNLSTESARSELDRIDSEYDIAFSVFKELAGQLEQGRIQVNRDTPVFMNIQPIVIPQQKSKPKSFLIIVALMVIGFLIPTSSVVVKQILHTSNSNVFE